MAVLRQSDVDVLYVCIVQLWSSYRSPRGGGGERVHEHSSRRQIVNFWLGVLLSSTFLLPFVHKIVFFIQTYVVMYALYVSISSQQIFFFFVKLIPISISRSHSKSPFCLCPKFPQTSQAFLNVSSKCVRVSGKSSKACVGPFFWGGINPFCVCVPRPIFDIGVYEFWAMISGSAVRAD